MPALRVCFIGAGNMATALAKGWLEKGLFMSGNVSAVDVSAQRRELVQRELGIKVDTDTKTAVCGADVVIIAVKPQQVGEVLPDIKKGLKTGALVISIAAGIKISLIESALGTDVAVVRVMPNTPCIVGAGAAGLSSGRSVSPSQEELALKLFNAVGVAYLLPEKLLDAVTGLSGSGPAFVYLVIEALASGGVQAGLSADVARGLAAQTVLGAALMVMETGEHPAVLRDKVTSPAGTTAAGLLALEEGKVRATFIKTVMQTAERSRELGESS